jgi:hypothetical protein
MTTFKEAIAARGLKEPKLHSVRYWNTRPIADRSKVWPGRKPDTAMAWAYQLKPSELTQAFADLNQTDDAAAYVRAWTRLNHLKE